jgi:hypothetical protein
VDDELEPDPPAYEFLVHELRHAADMLERCPELYDEFARGDISFGEPMAPDALRTR